MGVSWTEGAASAGFAEWEPDPSCRASGRPDVECVAGRSRCDETTVELRGSVHRARTEPHYAFAVDYSKPAVAPEGRGVIEERELWRKGRGTDTVTAGPGSTRASTFSPR